jgi:hypothetical protein
VNSLMIQGGQPRFSLGGRKQQVNTYKPLLSGSLVPLVEEKLTLRPRIEYPRPATRPQAKRTGYGPPSRQDRPTGVRTCPEPAPHGEPRMRARKFIPHEGSGRAVEGPGFQHKRAVYGPNGQRLVGRDAGGDEWSFKSMYGEVKVFGGKRGKTFSHGLVRTDPNYPPERDGSGKVIDYSLAMHGGFFGKNALRPGYMEVATNAQLAERGVLKHGAVHRYREAQELKSRQQAYARHLAEMKASGGTPGAATQALLDTKRPGRWSKSGGIARRPATASPAMSSRMDAATTARIAVKDARIAHLRAQLAGMGE